MHKTPLVYAGLATIYIALIAFFLFYAPTWAPPEDTIAMPIAALSLFVLSAAIMGFLFLSQPIMLYLDGRKDEAVRFFGRTVMTFALLTATFFIIIFFTSLVM